MNIIEQLNMLGLNGRQAKVYLTLLQLGSATAIEIAKAAKYKHPTVYDVLDALKEKRLVTETLSNGKKLFCAEDPETFQQLQQELGGKTLGETLLTPTKIYVKSMLALMKEVEVKAVSHITGGGFYENIPRSLPKGCSAKIKKSDVRVLPIFSLIEKVGNIPERDMYNTFNMGVGMSVVVAKEDAEKALEILNANGETAYL